MPPNPPFASKNDIWTICDGLFAMPLPTGWRYEGSLYEEGTFVLPAGQRLACRADSLDAPELIAAGRAVDLVREPDLDMPPLSDDEITGNVIMALKRATADAPAQLIWKTVDILDDRYVRSVRFSWTLEPAEGGDAAARSETAAEVMGAISQGQFADRPTPLDRVAPTTELKRITPWGRIHIRVPEFWRYERAEDGRFVCDVLPEQAPPDPTLWFDYDQFSAPSNKAELDQKLREAAVGFAATLGSPDQVQVTHDADGTWIESVAHGEEDGTPLVFYNMHRHVAGDGCFIVAHFNLVLTAEDARSPAGQQLIDLMHREIHNAIVLPVLPGEEAGSAKS